MYCSFLQDTNFDGKLSRAELQLGYHEYLGLELSADDLDEVFDRSDLDKSGYLEYFEFVIATVEKSCLLSQNRLKAVFNIFDKKGEGYITTENLKQNLSKTIDDEALSRILWQVDDGDGGRINFKKFQTIMQSG